MVAMSNSILKFNALSFAILWALEEYLRSHHLQNPSLDLKYHGSVMKPSLNTTEANPRWEIMLALISFFILTYLLDY